MILAYSGGLDTSVAIPWLAEGKGLDVVALGVDVGQGKELGDARQKALDEVRERALKAGAIESVVASVEGEFADRFVAKALAANALYEGKYPLVSSLSRPLIAKCLVDAAHEHGASYVAHGCTGKGNDQVRFEVSIAALDPELQVIAPARDWGMSREDSIEYAKRHEIPVPVTKKSPYSIDENLWGRTIECGALEDPWIEPPQDAFQLTAAASDAPDEAQYLVVGFEGGRPTHLDGERIELVELIETMAGIGGKHGFGRVDMIENRLVGIKSREIYEVPAALALIEAHRALEDLTLERDLLHYKAGVDAKYAELVYYGLWYSPLKEALDAFIAKTQEAVSGEVRLKFYKGSCAVAGRRSEGSLYDYDLATYEPADTFSHESARGFIELFGLPVKVWAKKRRGK